MSKSRLSPSSSQSNARREIDPELGSEAAAEKRRPLAAKGRVTFEQQSGTAAIDRVVAVLDAFTKSEGSLGVTAIARLSGLSTSTVHRILTSLVTHGLVIKVDQVYALGPKIHKFAAAAHGSTTLTFAARPIMVALRDATGETVGLHVNRQSSRFVISQAESLQPLRRVHTEWGVPIPLYLGAPGKLLLAYLPESQRRALLGVPMKRVTDRTIVDPAEVEVELACIRSQGYAFSNEERVQGVMAIAVPIWDYRGEVIAALSVTGPTIRIKEEQMHLILPTIINAGQKISEIMGYHAS